MIICFLLYLFTILVPPAGAARTAATFDGKSCTKPPHASFTNNLYASTIRRVNSLLRHPRIFVNQRKAQTIHAFEVCFGYSYCSLSYRGNKVSRLYVVFVNMNILLLLQIKIFRVFCFNQICAYNRGNRDTGKDCDTSDKCGGDFRCHLIKVEKFV